MSFSAIKVNGKDVAKFLQAQASNDLTKLNQDQGTYAAFLTPQAQIKALTYIYKKSPEEFFILCENPEQLKEHLEKFVIVEDVNFVITSSFAEATQDKSLTMTNKIELDTYSKDTSLIQLHNEHPTKNLLEKYISFTKGCFPGQEPLAKFKNIGMRKREERSQEYLEEALEIFARAKEANQEEELEKSIQLLKKALQENPKNEDAYESLGVVLGKQGKIPEAIKVMHQLEMINPNSIMAQTNLSILYMKLGDKETAEEHKAKGTLLQFNNALQN